MVTSSWFMVLPEDFTPEKFENWYLDTHTGVAKQCQDLVCYSISRGFAEQPPQAHGDEVFRIAQLRWESPEKLRDSFISYSGSAVRGDALLNMGGNPYIAITEDVQLDVAKPAVFDTFRRQYRTADGTVVKVLAFGMSEDAGIRDWYTGTFGDLGQDERVRQHNFGTSINRTLTIGLLSGASLPSEGQGFWDWMLELWFDSKADAAEFLADEQFSSMWSQLKGRSTETHLSVLRAQDIFVSTEPIRHVEE